MVAFHKIAVDDRFKDFSRLWKGCVGSYDIEKVVWAHREDHPDHNCGCDEAIDH